MKKYLKFLIIIIICSTFVSCSSKQKENISQNSNFEDFKKQAKNSTVNFYMWGGSESVNNYIDKLVIPKVKKEYSIDLKRIPISDAKDMVNKLKEEKDANKSNGSIDLMWINGENFSFAKENNLLQKSFSKKLPNSKYLISDGSIDLDFAEKTQDLEVAWGKAKFVFIYDSNKIENPPKNYKELSDWIKNNPGKFTYPSPPDFTGSAFLRQILLNQTSNIDAYKNLNIDEDTYKNDSTNLYSYLNELKPYLWRKGATYPENIGKLDQLYSASEVYMSMSYNPSQAQNLIKSGIYPKSTKTFYFESGSLSNNHYLAIPFNSSNSFGARCVINTLLDPELQMKKMDPSWWGDLPVISKEKLDINKKTKWEALEKDMNSWLPENLLNSSVGEFKSSYVNDLEKGWQKNVLEK